MSKRSINPSQIAAYASYLDPAITPYFCAITGELASGIIDAIRISICDYLRLRFVHHWCRTRTWQE